MARHWFGGAFADWTFNRLDGVDGNDNLAQLAGGVTVTFWNLEEGGTQHTDLLDSGGGATISVESSDGTDGREVGTIPPFQGPDGVWWMWAEAAGGPRAVIVAWDIGDFVATALDQSNTNASDLSGHLSGTNPHAIKVTDLGDVDLAGLADGEVLGWDETAAMWVPTDVEGITGVVLLADPQTITGHKTFRPAVGTRAVTLEAASGQTSDLLRALTEAALETLRVDPSGNLLFHAAIGQVGVVVKARSGQTANLTRWTDSADNPIAWVESDGRVRGPNQGYVLPYSIPGELAVTSGRHRIYNDTGSNLTIRNVRASVGVAPTGGDVIVDVNRNGTTIFSTQANRPTIPDGSNTSGKATGMDITTLNDGQYITVDIDQVGSTTPGEDLTVQLLAY